ncbi:PLD nuclease N-terminal domain-containing protein [Neobacillus sp. K501]
MLKGLLVYYLIVAIYLLIHLRKRQKNIVVKLIVSIFCPFFGLIILYFMFHNRKVDGAFIPEGIIEKQKEQADILRKVDFERETSFVPMKDALLLNDNQTKRKMLLDILKNDTFSHIGILQTALHNDDSETSHYAATAIQDIKSQLLSSIQQMEYQLEKHPDNQKLLTSYAEVIKSYVNTGFLDKRTEKKYYYHYSQMMERIIEIVPTEKDYYIKKINCDILLGELSSAEKYCQTFLDYCSNEEEAYFMSMKLYFSMKNQVKFNKTLQMLRESSVRLSPNGLNKIRFWLQGDSNE